MVAPAQSEQTADSTFRFLKNFIRPSDAEKFSFGKRQQYIPLQNSYQHACIDEGCVALCEHA
jgi:hypothetical protein